MKVQPVTCFERELLRTNLINLRKKRDLSRDDVVRLSKTGLSRSSLQAWEGGEREPKLDYIYDLAEIYGVHPWELLSGEDLLERDSTPTATADTTEYSHSPTGDTTEDTSYIPIHNAHASAGHGAFNDDEDILGYLPVRSQWLNTKAVSLSNLVVIYAKGDSMEPTIPNHSALIIDKAQTQAFDGNIYIIRVEDNLLVKRTQWLMNGDLSLISDNDYYSPQTISKSDLKSLNVQICGQVIHTSHDL